MGRLPGERHGLDVAEQAELHARVAALLGSFEAHGAPNDPGLGDQAATLTRTAAVICASMAWISSQAALTFSSLQFSARAAVFT